MGQDACTAYTSPDGIDRMMGLKLWMVHLLFAARCEHSSRAGQQAECVQTSIDMGTIPASAWGEDTS